MKATLAIFAVFALLAAPGLVAQDGAAPDRPVAERNAIDAPSHDSVLHDRHITGDHERDVIDGIHKALSRHHDAGIRAGVRRADFDGVPESLTEGHRRELSDRERDEVRRAIDRFRDRGGFGGDRRGRGGFDRRRD